MRTHELLILYAILFLVIAGFGIVFPLLPLLIVELGATSLHMGLLLSLYALCQFLFAPFWGNVSDRIGRKPVLMLGLVGFSVSFVLMGMARSVETLIAARVLGGLLSAATMPTAQAYVADATSPEERGRAMGRMGAAIGLGFMVGPMLGGALSILGLRTAFHVTGALSLATAGLAGISLKEPSSGGRRAGRRLSAPAAIRYAVASPHAVLFWLAFVVTFCGSTMFSMIGLYVAQRFGADGLWTSAVFTVMGIASAAVQGLAVGPLVERFGEARTILAGLAFGVGSYALLALVGSPAGLLVAVAGASTAMSLIRPTITSAVSRRASHGQGVTMGIQTAFDSLGRVLGPLAGGLLYAWEVRLPFAAAAALYALVLVTARRPLLALHAAPAVPAAAPGGRSATQAPLPGPATRPEPGRTAAPPRPELGRDAPTRRG